VDTKNAGDLKKSLPIEKIGGKQKSVFRRKALKSLRNGIGKASKLGGDWRRGECRCWNIERIEWSLAMGAAMVIDISLRQCGAKPA
jgi:hypothetical protein